MLTDEERDSKAERQEKSMRCLNILLAEVHKDSLAENKEKKNLKKKDSLAEQDKTGRCLGPRYENLVLGYV